MGASGRDGSGLITGINVTPLVDVMLVLLVIFLVTARLVMTPAVALDLPEAESAESTRHPLALVVEADGGVLLDRVPLTDDQLVAMLTQRIAREPETRVVIYASRATTHVRILHAIDLLKRAGAIRIAFAAEPLEGTP